MSREQWLAGRPAVTPENALVLSVWRFCEGWNPERFGIAAAYYRIADIDFLLEQLLVMRERIEEHRAAERATQQR